MIKMIFIKVAGLFFEMREKLLKAFEGDINPIKI